MTLDVGIVRTFFLFFLAFFFFYPLILMILALDLLSFDILAFFENTMDPMITPTINIKPTMIIDLEYSEYSHTVKS
jgi:hypothetical protein